MPKIKLFLLFLLNSIVMSADAQITQTIHAGGGSSWIGTYTTGGAELTSSVAYTRSDDMIAVSQSRCGYAVFDLAGIPAGATISSVQLGMRINSVTVGVSSAPTVNVYGTGSTFSIITDADTLYNYCGGGAPGASLIASGSLGIAPGQYILTHSSASDPLCTLVAANAGGGISISLSTPSTTNWFYDIGGETSDTSTTGMHAPFLKVTYILVPCSGTPAPGIVTSTHTLACAANVVTLTNTGTPYGVTHQWQSSPDSIIWSNVTGATSATYTFTGLTSTKYYRNIVTCPSSGLSTNTAGIKIAYTSVCPHYNIIADSIGIPVGSMCDTRFFVRVDGTVPTLRIKTYYGDGSADSLALMPAGAVSYLNAAHAYAAPGYYSIKQILYDNNVPQDTITFTYQHNYCNTFAFKLYFDMNGDCVRNTGESFNGNPVTVRVDSAGVTVANLSVTSGFYYRATGGPGTVYAFSLLPGTLQMYCPSSGVLYDTVDATASANQTKYIGLSCSSTTPFDLAVWANIPVTGMRDQWGNICVRNKSCVPVNAVVTLHYSTKYGSMPPTFRDPLPVSSVLGEVKWQLTGLAANTTSLPLYYAAWAPWGALLTAGDTVHEYITVEPMSGDMNPADNEIIRVDTVRASCDPNFVEVLPPGCFDNDTEFKYTIHFENTGTDTAHNIYVLDTLSDKLDLNTMKIVMATADMDVVYMKEGGYNIIKYDFPNIKLLDSSHHGLCDGAFIYTIKNKPGIPVGSVIKKRVGIYFDYNDVVLTNTTENVKGCPPPVRIQTVTAEGVTLFPNPTTHTLTIKTTQQEYTTYTITNSLGQTLLQQSLTGTQTTADVHTLPAGVYYVTLRGSGAPVTMKFVKM